MFHSSHGTFLFRKRPTDGDEGAYLHLIRHAAVDFHELLDPEAFEGRHNRLQLLLDEYSVETVLIADRLEDVELNER